MVFVWNVADPGLADSRGGDAEAAGGRGGRPGRHPPGSGQAEGKSLPTCYINVTDTSV